MAPTSQKRHKSIREHPVGLRHSTQLEPSNSVRKQQQRSKEANSKTSKSKRPAVQPEGPSSCVESHALQPGDSAAPPQPLQPQPFTRGSSNNNMKFGKRLASEAARRWSEFYFDYKLIKNAIKDDIDNRDAHGANFQGTLVTELQKVSRFYSDKAAQLEETLQKLQRRSGSSQDLAQLRVEVQELIKFVALNYLAVVKAIKKRNRHLKENFGSASSTSLDALDLLGHELFFTSPSLAALATQAEILSAKQQQAEARGRRGACPKAARAPPGAAGCCAGPCQHQLLEEYQCPICLETLHNPVVLTCAHRFCWGCLVAHCSAARHQSLSASVSARKGAGLKAEGSTSPGSGAGAGSASYRVLEQIAMSEEAVEPGTAFYNCPVCRKPQVMDVESLQVDQHLSSFIDGLRTGLSRVSLDSAGAAAEQLQLQLPWGILSPQPAHHAGKLTVLLDVDGTLISSFTPRRAPRLPASVKTHVVGIGSKLNPQGVFVVERPGLRSFLEQLSLFAEVIVFTAGLEDYARPIIDALDPQDKLFTQRIYRDGCLKTEYYQCVKDMARVNRDLRRTVLVDDTPLAFLHQPDNGVPVLGFRGDPDDRLLLEAVLPLLQVLDQQQDVRDFLQRRFDMGSWFKRHGFPVDAVAAASLASAAEERAAAAALGLPCGQAPSAEQMQELAARAGAAPAAAPAPAQQPAAGGAAPVSALSAAATHEWLVVSDLDHTLLEFGVAERLLEALAPELLPMLVGLEAGADAVPITNTLLAELQRRGVSRDQLVAALQDLGAELPPGCLEALRCAKQHPAVRTLLLSDCNSVFIAHILAGAKAGGLVDEVTANPAAFENVEVEGADVLLGGMKASKAGARRGVGQKLVVKARGGAAGAAAHGCKTCAGGVCKGAELRGLRQQGVARRMALIGAKPGDVCAALALGPQDCVLVRRGSALAEWMERAAAGGESGPRVLAQVLVWGSPEELQAALQQLMS